MGWLAGRVGFLGARREKTVEFRERKELHKFHVQ
jgi:hypothetical protein